MNEVLNYDFLSYAGRVGGGPPLSQQPPLGSPGRPSGGLQQLAQVQYQ